MPRSVLVIAAHPDDEILGCGGAVARHISLGDDVNIVIVAQGALSRYPTTFTAAAKPELDKLALSAKNAASCLGVQNVELLDYPDNRLDSIDRLDVIQTLESKIQQYLPHTIYTHHIGDLNVDHRRIHEAVLTAARPLPGSSIKLILAFEVMSSTEWNSPSSTSHFIPNYFIDISEFIELKTKALLCYDSEMRPWPHARSVQAVQHLAHLRGAQIGCNAAEAFQLIRQIS
tara:strand:- start:14394 stop:15083 length:690 start_codon:yes stop_codon:yes gene_type:complete